MNYFNNYRKLLSESMLKSLFILSMIASINFITENSFGMGAEGDASKIIAASEAQAEAVINGGSAAGAAGANAVASQAAPAPMLGQAQAANIVDFGAGNTFNVIGSTLLEVANSCVAGLEQVKTNHTGGPTNLHPPSEIQAVEGMKAQCEAIATKGSLSMTQGLMFAGAGAAAGMIGSQLLGGAEEEDLKEQRDDYGARADNLQSQLNGTQAQNQTLLNQVNPIAQPAACATDATSEACTTAVNSLAFQLQGCQNDPASPTCTNSKNQCAQGTCNSAPVEFAEVSQPEACKADAASSDCSAAISAIADKLDGCENTSSASCAHAQEACATGQCRGIMTVVSTGASSANSTAASGAGSNSGNNSTGYDTVNEGSGNSSSTSASDIINGTSSNTATSALGICANQPDVATSACYDTVNYYCWNLYTNNPTEHGNSSTCADFCTANPSADGCSQPSTQGMTAAQIADAQASIQSGQTIASSTSANSENQRNGANCSDVNLVNTQQCYGTMSNYCAQYGIKGHGCLTFCAYHPTLPGCR